MREKLELKQLEVVYDNLLLFLYSTFIRLMLKFSSKTPDSTKEDEETVENVTHLTY